MMCVSIMDATRGLMVRVQNIFFGSLSVTAKGDVVVLGSNGTLLKGHKHRCVTTKLVKSGTVA
jgi:hypothetical protein